MQINGNELLLTKALKQATARFGGTCFGEIHYGWHNKSVGQAIGQKMNQLKWAQVSSFPTLALANSHVDRINQANFLKNVLKPYLYHHLVWQEENLYLVALLMTYIQEPFFSINPYLNHEVEFPPNWLMDLKIQLESLSVYTMNFVSCRQDLITRRIQERFGGLNCQIQRWNTIHGDLNWKNVTSQKAYFLDWEGWGTGPLGLDVCFLYCFSLLAPKTTNKIKLFFNDYFQSRQGNICLLFVCAELLRMIEVYEDHPELHAPLSHLARDILEAHAF